MTAPATTPSTDQVYNVSVWDHAPAPRIRDALPTQDSGQLSLMPIFTSTSEGVIHVVNAKVYLLHQLADGWLGEGSLAPKPSAIDQYREFLRALGGNVPLRAEPVGNADGGVEIEWKTSDAEHVIEFTGDDNLWLFENRGGEFEERTVEPFDVMRAVEFFRGEPI